MTSTPPGSNLSLYKVASRPRTRAVIYLRKNVHVNNLITTSTNQSSWFRTEYRISVAEVQTSLVAKRLKR